MTTGDDLLLLAIDPGKRRLGDIGRLRFALRAAELADLELAGRISVGARLIEVRDTERVPDRRLGNVLHALATASPPPRLPDWLRQTPRSLATEYLSRLADQKAVRVRRWRDRTGRTRHDLLSVDTARRRTALARLDAVLGPGPGDPPATDADRVLAALVQAAGLAHAAYPGLRGRAARRRLAALAPEAAATAVDEELADAIVMGADLLSARLSGELRELYEDFGTGASGHGGYGDSWSDGGGQHHGGGHHGGMDGGQHGGDSGGGGGHGGW
ncbi:Golgi phosphoprotein 3 (GPP34) [Actinacidiphila alni]|uniref:Golgi phosphoprotein 3 (GPP34) n=1 Tax=Actinacidiphila alni TaxID=380248 RepID=A0A1I1XI66_9ACTN|nr:GPP34 family phosphoprotein [Actinacidiphila alni]SFE07089.1 Golgi phosphoprotein 3 (GPP34) [Actinacidiphila alni]